LQRIRAKQGLLWPESFAELERWIDVCGASKDEPEASPKGAFFPTLCELARRRFPVVEPIET
jgi:hypothetical protein